MISLPRRLRTGLAVPILFALVCAATFVGLGTWQLGRKAWKEALIETLQQRLSAQPTELPSPETWPRLRQADEEFRRVKVKGEIQSGREAFLYGGGSSLRPDIKMPGYFLFTPARTRDGALVVINRGHVPETALRNSERYGPPTGMVEIVGVLRWPQPANPFVTAYDPAAAIWFVRDHREMAARHGWGAVAPFYVEMESPQPPGGLPRAGALRLNLRNDHLQYAITWYGLALVVMVMFGVWLMRRSAGP